MRSDISWLRPNIERQIMSELEQLYNLLETGRKELKRALNVNVTANELNDMVHKSGKIDYFMREISGCRYDTVDNFLDTIVREEIYDAFAISVTGSNWPIYADGDYAWEEFKQKVKEWEESRHVTV